MADEYSIDPFDRILGALHGLPDVVCTRQATVRAMTPLTGNSETFIVQTYRQSGGEDGKPAKDTIFVEYIGRDRSLRLVLPSGVADVVARQRDQLGSMNRRKSARRVAQERKEAGIVPGFMRDRVVVPGEKPPAKRKAKKRRAKKGAENG